MNLLIFIPLALLIVPFIPTFIEIFKRKDRGPREIPEQTTYEETPELESELPEPKEEPSEPEEEAKSGISRLRRAQSEARTKITGDVMRITGNVSIPDGTEIKNHLMVQGNLKVGKNTHIYGSIKAFGDIELGEKSIVEGHVLSEGKVVIGRHCVVKGIVDSLKDIILKENATVEAVSTEKTVRVGPNAKINRRILSGTSIVTLPQQLREEAVKPEEIEPTPEIKPISEVKAEEKPQIPAGPALKPLPPPSAEEKPAVMGGEIPFEYLDPEVDHLYLYAPTRYGKTYLIRNYIIPRLASKKKIVVIDNHREYPFEPYTVNYDKTIPNIENDLFKTFITFNIWGDIEGIIEDMINHVEQAKGHVSIRPNIIDDNVERLIMSEFLKRMTQIRWKVPILLIIEEADKYDVLSAVTRGRHANMQVILTSAKRLMPEVFSNAHLVLGSINPTLIRDYDPFAAEAVAALGRHEFIWEKNYHDWRRFKLSQEPTYQPPSSPKPRIVEEEKPIEKIQIAQIIDRPSLEETMPEPDRVTENIFEYLEERIKMLEEANKSQIELESLAKLTPLEEKVLEAASALDVEVVCTLAGGPKEGKDKHQTIMEDFPQVFGPIVDYAKDHDVKIAFENWFATNLQGLDHFEALLKALPSDVLGFNFDPSHLFWQQIDYIEAVHRFGDRIFHTHAKDTEVLPFKLRELGVLGRGWWRYRIPGWGGINWPAYITALKEVGYDYVLSIEHEDPFFGPEEGFLKGKDYLQKLL